MADYSFLTTWIVDAPIERVWDVIYATERWPAWWPGVLSVTELHHADGNGEGTIYRHVWRSTIPYSVRFDVTVVEVQRPNLIAATAEGGLAGTGTFRLFEAALGTAVTYDWRVRTTKAWMNAIAPLARPVFAWNHHAVMKRGGRGLAKVLGVPLVAQSSG
ncbi:MAG TPA: SRPBCC family protein [Gaiellaceae bacterium]|nr:SRPBCC family protein [Gaiellaceae bacterium]